MRRAMTIIVYGKLVSATLNVCTDMADEVWELLARTEAVSVL
jgi:hypothetical protein